MNFVEIVTKDSKALEIKAGDVIGSLEFVARPGYDSDGNFVLELSEEDYKTFHAPGMVEMRTSNLKNHTGTMLLFDPTWGVHVGGIFLTLGAADPGKRYRYKITAEEMT